MKRVSTIALPLLLCSLFAIGASKYWVGPLNGNWSDQANWSNVMNGNGGATVPSSLDSVIFNAINDKSLVHVDISPTILSLWIRGNLANNGIVTLYASSPITFTLLESLNVNVSQTLKDSTSADVRFNFVFSGASQSTFFMRGDWIFEGGVPVNSSVGNGAGFTVESGAQVMIAGTDILGALHRASVILAKNSNNITCDPSSLTFAPASIFVLENNPDATIPNVTWAGPTFTGTGTLDRLILPSSSIRITGSMGKLTHSAAVPRYWDISVDLPDQKTDASLNLPDGTFVNGNLNIINTNNQTLTLLASSGPSSSVTVKLGETSVPTFVSVGLLSIDGNAKVALATATSASAATSYNLQVLNFTQSGGNFSLQDYNSPLGSSILVIKRTLVQTSGTFVTNSSTTNPVAKFIVEMNGPLTVSRPLGVSCIAQLIRMSSKSIDNSNHMVTLRIVYEANNCSAGVNLESHLTVGKLELLKGTLNTTDTSVITVANPDISAITVGTVNPGSVKGPLRRWTNSTNAYNFYSCMIVPASADPSLYQAQGFGSHPDFNVSFPLKGISTLQYFNISRVSGADAKVQFTLSGAVPGATNLDALVVAHYVNGVWIAENGSVLTPANVSAGSVISKQLSSFGSFTFGYADPANLQQAPSNGLSYKYYEGGFSTLPDFTTLIAVKTGSSANIDLSVRRLGLNDSFAILWEGYINITLPGTYTFETVSDDGSKLYFNSLYTPNGIALVNNDGTHPSQSATGSVNITAPGRYPIAISYFENFGFEGMQVYWRGPGIERQLIPDTAFAASASPPTSGLNYKYYEGNFDSLPDFSTLTLVKSGNTPNIDLGVRPAGVNDRFAFMWEGYINIPAPGTYTFETISDDGSKLYFNSLYSPNGTALVNNDGVHAPWPATGTVTLAAAGSYPIAMTFFEKDGGETMQVYWSGPGIDRQLIPDAAFKTSAPPPSKGLNYTYYEGDFNSLPDFKTLAPVKKGKSPNVDISIRPTAVNDHFGFVWEGKIEMFTPGTYTFEIISDDGSKLYFNSPYSPNETALVNNDGLHPSRSATGTVTITASGYYPIAVTFFEKDGGEILEVYWTGPGKPRQRIPDAAFSAFNGLNYRYYEGDFNSLPDFNTLGPVKTGKSANFDIGVRPTAVDDHFAFMWEGYINIPAAGTYTFETVSDDGSKVYFNTPYSFNGPALVNSDGLHAPWPATGTVTVNAPGLYPITVTYFEKDGGERMQLYWTGPGIDRQLIPDVAFSSDAAGFSQTITTSASIPRGTEVLLQDAKQAVKIRNIYPNPFTQGFSIDFYNTAATNNITVDIYDVKGRLVYAHHAGYLAAGNTTLRVNLGNARLNDGVYIAKVIVNGKPSKTVKLVKASK